MTKPSSFSFRWQKMCTSYSWQSLSQNKHLCSRRLDYLKSLLRIHHNMFYFWSQNLKNRVPNLGFTTNVKVLKMNFLFVICRPYQFQSYFRTSKEQNIPLYLELGPIFHEYLLEIIKIVVLICQRNDEFS